MVKVIGPVCSVEARGSVGGMTFSRARMGAYAKSKGGKVHSRTGVQQKRRGIVQRLDREFQKLSREQIEKWVEFGRAWPESGSLGRCVNLSGLSWFVRLNQHRVGAGIAVVMGVPVGPGCDYLPDVTIEQKAWGIVIDADPRPIGEQLIYLSRCGPRPLSRLCVPESRTFVTYLGAGSEWPYMLRKNGDL